MVRHVVSGTRLNRRQLIAAAAASGGAVVLPSGHLRLGAPALAQEAGTPQPGGELKIGLYRALEGLDPAVYEGEPETMLVQMVFDNLVYLGNDGQFHPGLANSWEISEDGLTATFHLRDDVVFHDGTEFNADAVKFHFDRCVDPATQSKLARALLGPYKSSEVLDPTTIQVNLSEPYAPLLDALSQGYLGIPSPTAVQEFGTDFENNLVGSGPFRFVSWNRGTDATIERNPDYAWGTTFPDKTNAGPPYVDRIIFKFIEEEGTRDALMDGLEEVNISTWPAALTLARWLEDPRYAIYAAPQPGLTWSNFINVEKPPTDDLRVRQAINYAIDKDTIVQLYYQNLAVPAWTVISAPTMGYDESQSSIYSYDPAQAEALLDEAGWTRGDDGVRTRDGEPLRLEVFSSPSLFENYKEIFVEQLNAVGFAAELIIGTSADRSAAGSEGRYNLINRQVETSDPRFLNDLFLSSNVGAFAWSMARDDELDALLLEQVQTTDLEARAELVSQATRHILEQAYVIPVLQTNFVWATSSQIQDYHPDLRVWFPYWQDAWFAS
jgi:peptide/nickel transport system substrate-binding protein